MKLYLLRHGIAEDAAPGQSDADRRLTPEGVASMQAEARALQRMGLAVDLVVSSPLPRARETAEIVAPAVAAGCEVVLDARLAPGAELADLERIVAEHPDAARLMVVGHNPDLPIAASELTGGAAIDLKKGGLIRVDTAAIEPEAGVLVWLLPPSALKG